MSAPLTRTRREQTLKIIRCVTVNDRLLLHLVTQRMTEREAFEETWVKPWEIGLLPQYQLLRDIKRATHRYVAPGYCEVVLTSALCPSAIARERYRNITNARHEYVRVGLDLPLISKITAGVVPVSFTPSAIVWMSRKWHLTENMSGMLRCVIRKCRVVS